MNIAAYLWKKMIKTPANEPCLKNLHWIHLEGKVPEVVLSDEALGFEHETEHTEQRWEHDTEGAGVDVPTWDSASTGVFSRKRGRNKSWKHLYQSGERNLKCL